MISAKQLAPKLVRRNSDEPLTVTGALPPGFLTDPTISSGITISFNPAPAPAMTIGHNGQVTFNQSLILPEVDVSIPGTNGQIGMCPKTGYLYVYANNNWSKL